MPEASARRLHDDDRYRPASPTPRLRVVGERPAPRSAPEPPRPRGSREEPRPGRPHPRAQIRPESASGARLREQNEARLAAMSAPRTIVVTGQRAAGTMSARRPAGVSRRPSPAVARTVARPDRLALWAVALGLVMAFLAAATAQGQESSGGSVPAAAVAER
jgi:hypothetical protein